MSLLSNSQDDDHEPLLLSQTGLPNIDDDDDDHLHSGALLARHNAAEPQSPSSETNPTIPTTTPQTTTASNMFRSRKATEKSPRNKRRRRKGQHASSRHHHPHRGGTTKAESSSEYSSATSPSPAVPATPPRGPRSGVGGSGGSIFRRLGLCIWHWLTRSPTVAANTIPTQQASFSTPRTSRWMGILARGVLWTTIVSLSVTVLWYSYELFNHGTDPHLVAWFSAGGFVLLGFPISMWAIVSHLANYNQPHVQVYIVRILWMVPLYSVGSWLAMRFRSYAIYIETVRDLYEAYVLYSFLQFLIQVLGGEEALVLMLKDKSPTRGAHMWGLQWCFKPWLMGQPYRKSVTERDYTRMPPGGNSSNHSVSPTAVDTPVVDSNKPEQFGGNSRAVKPIMWKSPFFVRCKFGVLQYVLLKFVSAICIMILEHLGWYHEGDFTPRGWYLYICFLTNLSQCWALYCLVFFYYATHNELSPIRPVGKFLSVKALVFFTWWQSVTISYLLWMDLIPEYRIQREDWTSEDVAKGLQDYLICVEMFIIAIVHSFVFPHSEYTPQAVEARSRALNLAPMAKWQTKKRLGRSKYSSQYLLFGKAADDNSANTQSLGTDIETELVSLNSESEATGWSSGNQFSSQFTNESPQMMNPQAAFFRGDNNRLDDPEANQERTSAVDALSLPSFGEKRETNSSNDALVDITEQDEEDDEDDDYSSEDADDESSSDDPGFRQGAQDEEEATIVTNTSSKHGFMRALMDTAIPTDMVDSTVGIVKGDYNVERKTLLNHATASDQYDLFAPNRRPFGIKKKPPPPGAV